MDLLTETNAPLILSATSCRDHPCQLVRPEVLLSAGLVHLLEPEAEKPWPWGILPSDMWLTKPFPWDWYAIKIYEDTPQAVFVLDDAGLVRRIDLGGLRQNAAAVPLLLWEDAQTARVAFDARLVEGMRRRLCLDQGEELLGWSLEGNDRAVGLVRHVEGTLFLRAMPADQTMTLTARPLSRDGQQGAEYSGAASGLSLTLEDGSTPCGFVFILQGHPSDGRGDVLQPYIPPNTLWGFHWSDGRISNATTGRRLTGRQDFVPVFRADWAMAGGDGGLLCRWLERPCLPSWHPLPNVAGTRIDTLPQGFRYIAAKRAAQYA